MMCHRLLNKERVALLCGLTAFLASSAQAADLSAKYTWQPLKVGGGGWVVGMDMHPTKAGLIYARTDVSGAYRWNPATSSWKQIVTSESMPPEFVAYGKYRGVDSVVGAPKDPAIAYMAYEGEIFRSVDQGDHWIATGFAKNKVAMEPNGEGRQEGERLAVDPLDSSVVYFGSIKNGLWVTRDGGKVWSKVGAIPHGNEVHGVNTIVFDPTGGVSGKRSKLIYVTVNGAGVFRSQDAGATWANISKPSLDETAGIEDAEVGPDGTYFVACGGDAETPGSVWRYAKSVWTNVTPPSKTGDYISYADVAINPRDAKQVVVMRAGGKCFVSADRGDRWSEHTFKLKSPDIHWLDVQQNYWLSPGEIAFDSTERGKLWFSEGQGVWWTKDLTTPEVVWTAESVGIEETCGNDIIAPPGGKPVGAVWDMGCFRFEDLANYTALRNPPYFMSVWALDWCPADPKFLVGVFRNHLGLEPHPNSTGYSTDGGKSWSIFSAVENKTIPTELEYGTIAVSANSSDNVVWAPYMNKLPYFSEDRGATWKQSFFGGPTTTGFGAHYQGQKPLCADRVLAKTFYFYRSDDGVYRSTDAGATFEKVGNPVAQRVNAILKSTPGHAGHLWFAEGSQGNIVGGLWHSTDGGKTWKESPYIEQAFNVGLGKPGKDGGYPTLFVAGVAKGQTGIYRSVDAGTTWDRIGGYPLGIFDWIDAMDGDKDVFGRVYLAFTSTGFVWGGEKVP